MGTKSQNRMASIRQGQGQSLTAAEAEKTKSVAVKVKVEGMLKLKDPKRRFKISFSIHLNYT